MLTYILVLNIAEDNVSISLFLISGAKVYFFLRAIFVFQCHEKYRPLFTVFTVYCTLLFFSLFDYSGYKP